MLEILKRFEITYELPLPPETLDELPDVQRKLSMSALYIPEHTTQDQTGDGFNVAEFVESAAQGEVVIIKEMLKHPKIKEFVNVPNSKGKVH